MSSKEIFERWYYFMVIGSKELIRDINSKLVLETIMKEEPISRAAISKRLGLTKATISAIVQQLLNTSLVIETGSEDTVLGRKPILLRFCSQAGIVASIDIGLNTISVLITDLSGEGGILKQIKTPPPEYLSKKIIELLTATIPSFPASFYGLIGITVGIHGIVSKNHISFSPYYDFSQCNLVQTISSYFHVPVMLENEANLSVIGESIFLSDQKTNLANISIHSGVGLGFLLNRQLYTGTHGSAGEFGHMIIELNGRACPCGNRGCLEQYLSERALLSEFASYSARSTATLEEFIIEYQNKTAAALHTMEHFLYYLSICINNIQNSLDPDIILINSSFTTQFPELIEQLKEQLNYRKNISSTIAGSRLQERSILFGGICVSVRNFLGLDHWIL